MAWGTPSTDDVKHEGIFSLVIDGSGQRTRALPSLYHGGAKLFIDRDIARVQARLVRTIETVLHADERPAFLASACRVGDRVGIYMKDVCNRETIRLRAMRAGLEVAEDPYVRISDNGLFHCEDWPPFAPRFIVVNRIRAFGATDNLNRGAFLTFLFGILRVGRFRVDELRHLVNTVKEAEILLHEDPKELVQAIGSL